MSVDRAADKATDGASGKVAEEARGRRERIVRGGDDGSGLGSRLPRRPSFPIMCTILGFENVAANVVHPVEPAFYIALGLPDWIFGAAFAAMAFGLFALAPLWGLVSDRVGRVPVLTATLFAYGLAQLWFLVSTTVPMILLARFVAGSFCSGVMVMAMAYTADVSSETRVGRNMAIFVAVESVCTALGYLVGGVVGEGDPGRSFVLQFLILAATSVASFALLAEGEGFVRSTEPLTLARANPLAAFVAARDIMNPRAVAFLAATLLAGLASSAFDNSFNYYLRDEFAFPTTYNGVIYAVMGIVSLAANLTVGLRLQRSRRVEVPVVCVLGLAAVTLVLTLLAQGMGAYLGLNGVFYVFNSMYLPLMQAYAVGLDPNGHGRASGVFNSVKSFGKMAGALIAGFVYVASPLAPFVMAVAAFALGALAMAGSARLGRSS